MINKLKRKFIILATVSVFIFMTVLIIIMNIINYSVVLSESDATLNVLGSIDSHRIEKDDRIQRPQKENEDFVPHGMSPEVPYESRFFTVTVSDDKKIIDSDFSKILSVNEDTADTYIKTALNKNSERGFAGQFRYLIIKNGTDTRIIFLDCGRKLDSFRSFLFTSITVGLIGCVAVFIAFVFAAKRIVKPISESYEKQKRFISDAGHEMKTPLTIINANLDLIESDINCEELSDIRSQTVRLNELTNNLVYLSKIEESEHKIIKVKMPLSDIVSETVKTFHTLIDAKQIKLLSDIKPDITINASPDAIRRLVSVLLENAVKYTQICGEITVTLIKVKKTAIITVKNTTENEIKKESLTHVFDRFYRTDESRNSETGGHGIGLSIAKAIADAHGGNISATTEGGKDFCVTVTLHLS